MYDHSDHLPGNVKELKVLSELHYITGCLAVSLISEVEILGDSAL